MAIEPCVAPNGRLYEVDDGYKENCNTCTCVVTYTPSRRSVWSCTDHACLIRPQLIQAVNDGPYSWRASNYSNLWGLTLDQGIRYRLGTFLLDKKAQDMRPIKVQVEESLPASFDTRKKWPGKLSPIQDQGNCGSSWAQSSIALTSDRLSVLSLGAVTEKLSVQHLLSCDMEGQSGCEGGHLDRAWWYIKKQGVVTEDCYPYTSGATNSAGSCLIADSQKEGFCPRSEVQFNKDKRYHSTPPYRIAGEREIMTEIMRSGPVQATMEVREDFYMYKSGIYSYARVSQRRGENPKYRKSGFHSVRIMGWGVEYTETGERLKYWICANSWGTDWGEDGYFRILRGVGESRIESIVIGVWATVLGDPQQEAQLEFGRRERLAQSYARSARALSYKSLPTSRRKRRLLKMAQRRQRKLRMRKQKKAQKAGRTMRRQWRQNKNRNRKTSKSGRSKKLSWKERKERRRQRHQRRKQLRRQKKKLKVKATLVEDQDIES
ncbi:tubulointerstitial nephritis antigen-like [Elysia marginata]|uniref:Tubulointerstitial nephritis antigen-like n=1 Tax=Elysia marginata TaxID=1093978 RepID=A0AAV4JNX7_9GAST|nr:tubulointerstitial nephritis antigen-like [Elysia marginata]